jgi:hypothetical protein
MTEKDDWPEVGLACNGGAGCVVVERIADVIVIRDSKNPAQAGLVFGKKEYEEFRHRVRGSSRSRAILQFIASALRSVAMIVRAAR